MKAKTAKNGITNTASTKGFVVAKLPTVAEAYPMYENIDWFASLVGIVGFVIFTLLRLLSGIDRNIIEPKKANTPKNTNIPKIMNESD